MAAKKKAEAQASVPMLRITLVRSTIGRPEDQERTVRSLGLRRLHHTVERQDSPSIRGMVGKIRHLVVVEEVAASE
jgi:large subunit ribosomal protein L30